MAAAPALAAALGLAASPADAGKVRVTRLLSPPVVSLDAQLPDAGAATRFAAAAAWSGVPADAPLVISTGSVAGRVTGAAGGAGIADVSVCAQRLVGSDSFGTCGASDSTGDYKISGLEAGSYTVEFSPGYPCASCAQQNYLTQYYNDKPSLATAETVTVTAGSTVPGIDAKMVEGGRVTGVVTNAHGGAPLERVEVCALVAGGEERARCATTSSGGSYFLAGLASGSYVVEFAPAGQCESPCPVENAFLHQFYAGKSALGEAGLVSVTAGSTTSAINAKLTEGGKVTGLVTKATGGAGIKGIDVCAVQGPGGPGGCVGTGASGEYTVSALPSGTYHVEFFAGQVCTSICPVQNFVSQAYDDKPSPAEGQAIAVTTETTTAGIDAHMTEGGQITGTVTNTEGVPVEGIEACALGVSDGFGAECAATNSDGEYVVQALAGGPYRVRFSSSGGYNCAPHCASGYLTQYFSGKASLAEAEPVAVVPGGTNAGIDARMVVGEDSGGSGGEPGPSGPPPHPPMPAPPGVPLAPPRGSASVPGSVAGSAAAVSIGATLGQLQGRVYLGVKPQRGWRVMVGPSHTNLNRSAMKRSRSQADGSFVFRLSRGKYIIAAENPRGRLCGLREVTVTARRTVHIRISCSPHT